MASVARARTLEQSWMRHELLRVAPTAWSQTLASRPDLATVPHLADWIDNGWPVIVRRRVCDDRAGQVPIGVPLPPSAGKLRIGLTIQPESVLERSSPPSLWKVRHCASASWKRAIRDLVLLGMRYAAPPTVIGSLFWQYRTGLSYLSAQSDIDLLWQAPPGYCIRSLLAGVETIERAEGIRIDGEVIFRDGSAVNWRELHLALGQGCTAEVLVKSMHRARLIQLSDLPMCWRAT